MANQCTAPFHWGEIALSQVVDINGIPHATKTAIGEWLEYADPRDAVNKIIERNPYLCRYSTAVKLTAVDGKNRDTEVYHPIGFLLIVMESGQPKAQAMKVAVAEFVWHYVEPPKLSIKERNSYIKEIEQLTERLASTTDAMLYQQRVEALRHYCRIASWPMPNLKLLGTDPKQLSLEI